MQVADLVRYNHVVRGLYFDAFAKLPWSKVVADRGLSFESMRNVFLHLTYVEDRWITFVIAGRSNFAGMDFDVYPDLDALRNYMQQTAKNTEAYRAGLSSGELKRKVVVPWGDGGDRR